MAGRERQMGEPVQIGDEIFIKRNWSKDDFKPATIIGETRVSWLVQFGYHHTLKLSKKTLPIRAGERGEFHIQWSREEVRRFKWLHKNRGAISMIVDRLNDYDKLCAIAEIIGYEGGN